jgi:Protein of unknown function (DUF1367)
VPLYQEDYEEKKKLKIGEVYYCDIKHPRNYQFLKKFFALIKLGWQNSKEFQEPIPMDLYRKWATIKAGYADIYHTSKGVMVEAKSISFANMEEEEFNEVYRHVLNVIIKDVGIDEKTIEEELINFM